MEDGSKASAQPPGKNFSRNAAVDISGNGGDVEPPSVVIVQACTEPIRPGCNLVPRHLGPYKTM